MFLWMHVLRVSTSLRLGMGLLRTAYRLGDALLPKDEMLRMATDWVQLFWTEMQCIRILYGNTNNRKEH